MADIRDLFSVDNENASSKDYSIMRKAVDESLGTALRGIGDVIEGGAKAVDNMIQNNIKNDLFTQRDYMDEEFGVVGASSPEAAVGLPEPEGIGRSRENLQRYTEAVRQGKLDPNAYALRADSIMRQLRVKYPGYREQIDTMVQQEFGFDPANRVRENIIRELDNEATNAAEARKEVVKRLEGLRDEVGNSAAYMRATAIVAAGGTPPPELMVLVEQDASEIRGIKLQAENRKWLKEQKEVNNEDFKVLIDKASVAIAEQMLGGMTLEEFVEVRAADGYTPEEEMEITQAILRMDQQLKTFITDTLNAPEYGVDGSVQGTKSQYFGNKNEFFKYSGELMEGYKRGVLEKNKDYNFAAIRTQAMEAMKSQAKWDNPKLQSDELIMSIYKNYQMTPGRDNVKKLEDRFKVFLTKTALRDNESIVDAVKYATRDDPSLTAKNVRNAVVALTQQNEQLQNPEDVQKNISAILNPQQNVLSVFSPTDREQVFRQMMSPQFLSAVQKHGTQEQKQMLPLFLSSSFTKIFKEDVGEFAQLANQDATGWQLSFDGKQFNLQREGGAAGGNLAQLSAFGNMPSAVGKINSFLITYKNALGNEYSEEQKAAMVAEMIQRDFGATTSPDAGGGFWYKAHQGIQNYLSGDKESKADVNIEPASATTSPVDEIAGALDKYESGGRDKYNALLGHSQGKFGVDVSEMTVQEVLDFQKGPEYREWSKDWKRKNRVGDPRKPSTPAGRYQIVGDTLEGLIEEMGLTGNELFDKNLQDQMFVTLLKRRGLDEYLTGKIDSKEFIRRAKDEWEGLKSKQAQRDFLEAVNRVKNVQG